MEKNGTFYTSPTKRNILGDLNSNTSPISPMANLKLLTKVATDVVLTDINKEQIIKTSRKLRSLSFICKKFLLNYPLNLPKGEFRSISLGCLAVELGIEKRRVYDIINVVASLQMAIKVCKDKYSWYGNQNLTYVLSQLKGYALQNRFDQQVKEFVDKHPELCYSCHTEKDTIESGVLKIAIGNQSVFEENRIGILCQKFIMLFLVADDFPLNLTTIAKLVLTKDIQDKTGMRRLYDVANVLESLGLIQKCNNKEYKKPCFIYSGPQVQSPSSSQGDIFIDHLYHTFDSFSDVTDSNSESSMDAVGAPIKMNTSFDAIRIESDRCSDAPPAKKRLLFPLSKACDDSSSSSSQSFSESSQEEETKPPAAFIKAATSFKYTFNGITQNKTIKVFPPSTKPMKTVILTKLTQSNFQKPVRVSEIENGGIYKAIIGNNNIIQFVKIVQ